MQAFSKKYPFTDMESKDHQGIAPVIIIGMHRSGTSMLARALSELGVFMGRRRTRNEECLWTNKINYWIFAQASATWERPEGMDTLLKDPDLCHMICDYIQGIASGPACMRYLGLRRYARYGSLFRVTEPWGWKDPRNTFTLPLWLTLFPNAKVVHIIRHGVDVAQSLRNRRNREANHDEHADRRCQPVDRVVDQRAVVAAGSQIDADVARQQRVGTRREERRHASPDRQPDLVEEGAVHEPGPPERSTRGSSPSVFSIVYCIPW